MRPGAAYGERVAERLRSCVGAGRLEAADAVGEAGSAACRALVRVELAVGEGTLQEASYQAYGCPATLACASEVTMRAKGASVLQAAAISEREIGAALGLAPSKETSAELAVEALHAALGSAVSSGLELSARDRTADERGVLVGMSGGVDSAVAAMLLQREGYRVVGATLKLWSDPASYDDRSCCSPVTVRRARRVAHGLGIPHLTVDASEAFRSQVVQYFVDEYGVGRTPNPCAKCNARVRLGLMVDLARRLGLTWIATGHYARLTGDPPFLTRGVDPGKDQSYVLAEVTPDILRRAIFPLGGMTKVEVRALAAQAGLEGHAAPESQEICFVPDDDHRRFLRERLGERPGSIVDRDGRVVGRHSGTYNFTIGQRKGLGIAAPEPRYVVAVDAGRCQVTIGEASESAVGTVRVGHLTRHRPGPIARGYVQLRSAGEAVPAHLGNGGAAEAASSPGSEVPIALEEAARGVAPGQTAVLYDGEVVVLAGTIMSTARWNDQGERLPVERGRTGPVI
ncbi:MAG: tRNA 2-thiouridine(34) synthase MnmA [bacterium]